MTLPTGKMRAVSPRTNSNGFTLIEALLVLAIAALLVTVTVPSLKATSSYYRFASTLSDFEKMVALCRQRSVMESEVIRLEVDETKHRITMSELKVSEENQKAEASPLQSRAIPSDIVGRCQASGDDILFYPDGTHTAFSCTFEQSGHRRTTLTSDGTQSHLVRQDTSL